MLNLIKAVTTFTCPVRLPPYAPDFLEEFPCQTNGMGKYNDEPARTHVDDSINLLAQPHCPSLIPCKKTGGGKTQIA